MYAALFEEGPLWLAGWTELVVESLRSVKLSIQM